VLLLYLTTGYTHHQFSGVVRRVKLDGHSVNLKRQPPAGDVAVLSCSSNDIRTFIAALKRERLFGETVHVLDSDY
jgi:hypothetical protein